MWTEALLTFGMLKLTSLMVAISQISRTIVFDDQGSVGSASALVLEFGNVIHTAAIRMNCD
jgi:hypothetical protein